MTNVLAIDQGTSGTKAIVVSADNTVLAIAEREVRPSYLENGRVEQDPQALLTSVLEAGNAAVAQAGVEIHAVSLANQGETVLAWDRSTGQPLTPMIVWQDSRAQSICDELQPHADLIQSRTGLVLDPYFSAPKQTWIRRNLTTDGVVTTSDVWLLHQLTGQFVTDATTASRSLVMDLKTGTWDNELLSLFGLEHEELPEIRSNTEVIGHTSAFGRTLPVAGIVVDQQAALLAQNCLVQGQTKCTLGTGAFLLAHAGAEPLDAPSGLALSIAWSDRGVLNYCFDGQVYAAASALRWLISIGAITHAAQLDQLEVEDSGGVIAVPSFAGLASPWWSSAATASFSGITLSTHKHHIVFAVVQGIAAQLAALKEQISQAVSSPLERLRVDGGLTQSSTLLQALADILQIPIDVYPSQHATALGAVAFARASVTPGLSLADAIISWQPSATFFPKWSEEEATVFLRRWNQEAIWAVERTKTL